MTVLRSQTDKLALQLPQTAEYVFIRFYYESQDLTPVPLLVLRFYFGKQHNLLLSGALTITSQQEDNTSGGPGTGEAVKLPASQSHQDKAKRQQLIARVS